MALTAAQKISLFEALGLPYTTEFTVASAQGGGVTRQPNSVYLAAAAMKSDIIAYLADGTKFDSDMETRLLVYITEWDSVKLLTANMQGGGAGSVSGMNYDPETQRARLREYIRNLVPFWNLADYIKKVETQQNGDGSSMRVTW